VRMPRTRSKRVATSPRRQAVKSLRARRNVNTSPRKRLHIRVKSSEAPRQQRLTKPVSPRRKLGPKPESFKRKTSRSPRERRGHSFSPRANKLLQRGLRPAYFQGSNRKLDDNEIAERYQKIMDMYSRGKISQKNAWRLKLVENIDRMLRLEAAGNYKKASWTIAAAAQIYRYRVDDVWKHTRTMMSNIIGGTAFVSIEKKRKSTNLNTIATNLACKMDPRQVLVDIDVMFHKTTAAFDQGGSRGLLMNNLSVHNGCDTILDSTTIITGQKGAAHENQDDFQLEDPSWISTLNVKHKPLEFQTRDICPIVKHIIKKIERVKQTPETRNSSRSDHCSKSQEFGMMDFFEEDDVDEYEALNNEIAALGDYDAGSYESVDADKLDDGNSCLVHPSLLKNWTGPEQWIRRRQNFRRKFKKLQKVHEEKKNDKAKESGNRVNFQQAANGEVIPEDVFADPLRPLSTKLTEASLLKFSNDLHIFPEDLQVEKKLLTKLFLKPKLHVSRHGVIKEDEPSPLDGNTRMNINIENEFDIYDQEDDHTYSSPRNLINSPTSRIQGDEGLQLVNERGDIEDIMMKVAKISKKINIKALKDCIWRHIYRHCLRGRQRTELIMGSVVSDKDVMTYPVATSFRSAMTYISNYYDKIDPRSKDELSVPFIFMALLHLANVKNLRFESMQDVFNGSNFKIMVDESTKKK